MCQNTYLVDFLFEALFEHLVSLVKNDGLESGEINIAPLNVVEHSSAGSHEEVDASSEHPGLVINVDSTIDGQTFELLGMVLQLLQLILNLDMAKIELDYYCCCC